MRHNELEKAEKKLKTLANVKPGYVEEVERLEREAWPTE